MMVEAPNKLGAFLRESREKKGLSQEALARRVGVTQGAISQFELGEARPSARVLWRLSRELGVSMETLMNLWEAEEAAHEA